MTAIESAVRIDMQESAPRGHRALLTGIVDALGARDGALILQHHDRSVVAAHHRPDLVDDATLLALCSTTNTSRVDGNPAFLPLQAASVRLGTLWLHWPDGTSPRTPAELRALRALADITALLLRNARLIDDALRLQQDQLHLRALLEQYVAPVVVDHLLDGDHTGNLASQRLTVTVLMVDMRGSTQLTVQLEPQFTMQLMNEYLGGVTDTLFRNGATIDRIEGDAIVALFGAPEADSAAAARAIDAGQAILAMVDELLGEWRLRTELPPGVGVGIGVATGGVVVGNIGSAKRLHYTAIGPAINLAARLAAKAPAGSLQMDGATWRSAHSLTHSPRRRYLRAKGFAGRIPVYCVTA